MGEIISGIGSFSKFDKMKKLYAGKRILLVTGKDSYSACGAESVLTIALKDENVMRFSDFEVNPKIEDAERGVALARDADVDLIIAVGGGSVIDMAKLIKAFYSTPKLSHELAHGQATMSDPNIPLIVAPTTAGSGSEATHFAVVYIGLNKYSVASSLLLPEIVFLDGKLITTGSSYQKACNGLDALAQAIESAWAVGSTNISRAYSFEAVNLCVKYLKSVVENDADDMALQGMLKAANLAGQAINISKTTAAHAWSYGITSCYGIPHGHAVWLTLPVIFQIHAKAIDETLIDPRGLAHLMSVMTTLMELLSISSSDHAEQKLREYLVSIDVSDNLSEIGVDTAEKGVVLSNMVNMQRMKNNPVRLEKDDISNIFSSPTY